MRVDEDHDQTGADMNSRSHHLSWEQIYVYGKKMRGRGCLGTMEMEEVTNEVGERKVDGRASFDQARMNTVHVSSLVIFFLI